MNADTAKCVIPRMEIYHRMQRNIMAMLTLITIGTLSQKLVCCLKLTLEHKRLNIIWDKVFKNGPSKIS